VARGNTASAVFSAAFSNILGVFLTPALVGILMQVSGRTGSFGLLLLQIILLTLVPFVVGMVLRPLVHRSIDQNKKWVNQISNAVILFIVYAAFCESVKSRVWEKYGLILTIEVLAVVVFLFTVISLLAYYSSRWAKLDLPDLVAVYFCSVKKTLAMGVPLAMLIFGGSSDISLILLPIMFYHPLQLFVNGVLANRWAAR
ncbi:MAG TPA: bile acid:sodium symporter, partial [Candidatus Solibacter sp.]|nr:bile acid:sodium symporter [Candidatus Solibacter sp.]